MTEPTTEAGRALNATLSYDADPPRYEPGDYIERYRAAILAIEAEARADCETALDDAYTDATMNTLRATLAAAPYPDALERFGDAVMAALRLRLVHGATDATYTPREVAEMVSHVIEKQVAALASKDRPGPQYTEDDPDWSAMVSPISERDGGHDDR